ncbi:MAG: hypothetical protein H6541_08800 [Lentimicrobiaceae bacterium]|nr:hypothetical protein [Lentimicrobiaceae bacterium]MCB9023689.1 hypothetical protein [Lentimicrobiaceae bacterium]HPG32611.1 hypothetical protein [Lentimicrobium sp.]
MMRKPGRHFFVGITRPCLLFIVWVVFFTFNSGTAFSQISGDGIDLSNELGNKYFDAVDFLKKNNWMADTLQLVKIQPAFAYGVVFPELVKYSAIRDVLETGAARMLYVQSGRKYSHYTIGRFQMKPSFAELVERSAMRQKITAYKFNVTNTAKARGDRAKRLDSQEWQLRYLVMFIKLMDKRYAHIQWKSEEDKLRFYATAFSVGFNRDERTIRRMMTTKSLLRQSKDAKSKYKYGDVALWFYQNDGYKFVVDLPEDAATK